MTTDGTTHAESLFRQAVLLHQQSRLDDARALYERALHIQPRHFHALHLLGVVALQKNQAKLAADLLAKALSIDPSSVIAHVNYGTAQHELKRFNHALASYERAIALRPTCAEAFFNRGNALRELKQYEAAVASYDQALAFRPAYADAHLNRGLCHSALGNYESAIACYERAIALQPNHADAYFNRGNDLLSLARPEAAIASYDRALAVQPGFADAHLNRGSALVRLRRYSAALGAYEAARALRPDHAETHCNRAGVLQHLGQFAAAVSGYDTAIGLRPNHAPAHADRARALRELRSYEAAIAALDRAVSLEPDSAALLAVRRHTKMQICDWRQLDADIAKITLALSQSAAAPNPFYIVTLLDSPASQRLAAGQWIRSQAPLESAPAFAPRPVRDKIHIGYFSADYHEHATSYLIAELFELHDRDRFRISAISFGPESHGPMRKRLQSACDEFIDVRDKSDAETVALCRAKHIDIAIDLKGFTQDNRLGIFSRRVAPLQVNYLGYPGTLAAPYIDYMIADRTLVPGQSQQHYSEKLIYLPHCYQANDTKRVIAEKSFTRAELGLPTDGFIFCCFNNSYKITPAIFHRWMRILARVENSVLWLLADNPAAVRNLRREAAARYVAPERLIFAEIIDLPHHLARHRAADLFLDTLPCNAHTTASDALWAGVPVLTCAGESLAARVAASLLTAIGLPELIASTQDQYELMAVDLAHDREKLAALARKLAENKRDAPLFDTPRFTRDIETGYEMILARHRAGEAPEHIDVPDRPSGAIVCSRD